MEKCSFRQIFFSYRYNFVVLRHCSVLGCHKKTPVFLAEEVREFWQTIAYILLADYYTIP